MHKPIRLSGRLYFFPAFLPLAELLPWLLTLIGAVAGVAGFSLPAFWAKHHKAIIAFALVCLITAAGLIVHAMPAKEVRDSGTRAIAAENLPRPTIYTLNNPAPPSSAIQTEFKNLWVHSTDKQILATPIIEQNLLIYGSYNGSTEAVSLNDGSPVWSLPQKAQIFALSRDGKGTIYSSEGLHDTTSSKLTAINPANGQVRWQREFLGHLEENVAFYDHDTKMMTSSGPGGLWALRTADGSVLWHQPLGHIDSRPLIANNIAYVPAQVDEKNHKTMFYALNATTGKIVWKASQPGQPWGSPLIDKSGQIILTTTGEGQIGMNLKNDAGWAQAYSTKGKLLWQVSLSSMSLQPATYLPEQDIVIYSQKNGDIDALNIRDGSVVWHVNVEGTLNAPATLITGFSVPMLAVTTYNGLFSVIRATDGALLARRRVGGNVNAAPIAHGDIVYVFSAYDINAIGGLHSLAEQK